MTEQISDVAALEACIGKTPGPVQLKVIDHLDEGAAHWIAASPMLFAAFGDGAGVAITPGGGAPGFARAADPRRLEIPAAFLDRPDLARQGQGFGALFLIPGVGETLRVNGRIAGLADGILGIAVEECYVHCAKALIRSDFWAAVPCGDPPAEAAGFLGASRFMALATIDAQGRADVSPKGDPAGMMIRRSGDAVCYADRPGNRRADSFRNILTQPGIAVAVLIPGSTQVALVSGIARITSEAAARNGFAVEGKVPLLATRIEQPSVALYDSPALGRARLWPASPRPQGIDPAAMLVAHVKLSKGQGLQARLVRTALSVPGLMERGLAHDYKRNLY